MLKIKISRFLWLSLFMILDFTSALYFHVTDSERKCFFEEIPADTTVIGNYKVELYDHKTGGILTSRPSIGMHVEVTDPNKDVLMSRTYTFEGKIAFTSSVPGEHAICLYSINSTSWFSSSHLRVHLDIQVGVQGESNNIGPHKEKVSDLQLRLGQLLHLVNQIVKEQNYARLREHFFRRTSQSTSDYVFRWGIAQVGILVVLGYWQMRNLRSFFAAKKLV